MKTFTKYKKNLISIAVALLMLISAQTIYAASFQDINDISRQFICNCGCNKLLNECDMQCGVTLRGVIAKKLDAGWSKDKISKYMVKNYNKQILAAPPKEGFDLLLAWISPFIVFAIGGGLVFMVIIAWVKSTQKRELAVESGVGSPDDAKALTGKRESGVEQLDEKAENDVGRVPRTRREEEKKKIDDEKYKDKLDEELKDFDW